MFFKGTSLVTYNKLADWVGIGMSPAHKPLALTNPNCLFSDFGFKMSEDLSLEVCVPDPEFSGKSYSPPVPCAVGSTYRRTRGYVSQRSPSRGHVCTEFKKAEKATLAPFILQTLGFRASRSQVVWAIFRIRMFTNASTL